MQISTSQDNWYNLFSTPELPSGEERSSGKDRSIRFDGVSFSYSSNRVLQDVNCLMPEGKLTALVGYSGSGKTILVNLIARAILKDAPIVLLDEATASLDPENEAEIQEAFDNLVAGKTLVVIAHRFHTILHAHQILALDEGRAAERGTHDELVKLNGVYAGLWREQNKARSWKMGHNKKKEVHKESPEWFSGTGISSGRKGHKSCLPGCTETSLGKGNDFSPAA